MSLMKFMYFSIILSLIACAPTPEPPERHNILGTTYGWEKDANKIEVLLDAKIDKLQIRHVRMADANCVSGFKEHIEISGEIGPDSTAALERLLPQLHKCQSANNQEITYANYVYLSSGGGFLADGYALGDLFREHQVSTFVTGGQKCASSCAIAFLGGKFRNMAYDAELLFHAPYLTNGIAIDCQDRGQVSGLKAYYQSKLGEKEGDFLLDRTMSYCSVSSGWTLNADGAKLFGITTN